MKTDQQALVHALLGLGEAPAALAGDGRGLEVYRNNLRALSAQALGVAFERLRAALGDEEFAALAWTYWRHDPPRSGDLGDWGGGLAGFLVERAGEDSGLPDLARLDWAVHQAERAADSALDAESLHLLGTTAADALWLMLRPGVRLLWQQAGPVLVWRAGWRGCSQAIDTAEAAFVEAVMAGRCLAAALATATAFAAALPATSNTVS